MTHNSALGWAATRSGAPIDPQWVGSPPELIKLMTKIRQAALGGVGQKETVRKNTICLPAIGYLNLWKPL